MCLWEEHEVIPSDHSNVHEATESEVARFKSAMTPLQSPPLEARQPVDYIAVITDTDIYLVGPFKSVIEALYYGFHTHSTTAWKCVILTDTFDLRIVTPSTPKTLPAAFLETS